MSAYALKKGDIVLLSDGRYGIIEKSIGVQLSAPETTYNLEVEDFHTYFVGERNVCVHNRGCNRLKPDANAKGSHTTFSKDPKTGQISHYAEWTPNSKNPTGFDFVKRFDGIGGKHTNSVTNISIPAPHIHGKTIPRGVRLPFPEELPRGY